jgi:hypothetical protein
VILQTGSGRVHGPLARACGKSSEAVEKRPACPRAARRSCRGRVGPVSRGRGPVRLSGRRRYGPGCRCRTRRRARAWGRRCRRARRPRGSASRGGSARRRAAGPARSGRGTRLHLSGIGLGQQTLPPLDAEEWACLGDGRARRQREPRRRREVGGARTDRHHAAGRGNPVRDRLDRCVDGAGLDPDVVDVHDQLTTHRLFRRPGPFSRARPRQCRVRGP